MAYAFESTTVHAGQSVNSQLTISSNAHACSEPLAFKEVKITYEGSLKTVLLRHKPTESMERIKKPQIINLQAHLHEADDGDLPSPSSIVSHTYMVAETDLSIGPGETKVFELSQILREAGSAKAICCTFGMANESFDFEFVSMFGDDDAVVGVHALPIKNISTTLNGGLGVWWIRDASGNVLKRPLRTNPDLLNILPRPPKMEVIAKGLDSGIYTDETVKIGIEVNNGEDEDAEVGVDVKIIGWPTDEGDLLLKGPQYCH